MIISVIAPPVDQPEFNFSARPMPTMQSSIAPAEDMILQAVRDMEPVHVWKLLNRLVDDEALPNRHEMRRRKVEIWRLVNSLLRRRMLFRAGRHGVATIKPSPPAPRFKQPERKPEKASTVVHRASDTVGSAANGTTLQEGGILSEEAATQVTTVSCRASEVGAGAESAVPLAPEERANAARALATLRWHRAPQKKLSGWLDKRTRVWRDRPIVLADGTVAYAYGALRGRVVYFLDQPRQMEPGRWGVVRAGEVKPLKNPAAVALGRLKRGVKERPSVLKSVAARRNGQMAYRPGCRHGHQSGVVHD